MIAFDSNTFFPYLLQWLEAIAKAGEGAPLKRPLYVINSEAFTIWRKHFGWLRELVNESNEQTGRGWLTSISMSSSRNSLHRSHFHHANNHAPILFPLSQPRRNTLISATSHSSCHDSSSLLPESMHHKLLKSRGWILRRCRAGNGRSETCMRRMTCHTLNRRDGGLPSRTEESQSMCLINWVSIQYWNTRYVLR